MSTGIAAHAHRPVGAGHHPRDQSQHPWVGGKLRAGPGIGPVQAEYLGRQIVGTDGEEVRDSGQFADRVDRSDRLHHRADRDPLHRIPNRAQLPRLGDHRHHDAQRHLASEVDDRA